MKMKKLAVSILSAGLIMSLGMKSTMASTGEEVGERSTDAHVKFKGGNLTFDEAKGSIDFKSQDIDGKEVNVSAVTSNIKLKIKDARGSGEGWRVTAQLSNFSKNDETPSLSGSSIRLDGGAVSNDDSENKPILESNIEDEKDGLRLYAGADAADRVINAFGNEDFSKAQGKGISHINWSGENISLNVPAIAAETGEHTASIKWTLISAPHYSAN